MSSVVGVILRIIIGDFGGKKYANAVV